MRVLITGVTGFVGSHLAEYLLTFGNVEVFGCYRWRSKMENLEDLGLAGRLNIIGENSTITSACRLEGMLNTSCCPDKLNIVEADMLDAFSMQCLINGVRPDRIFHLAAQSYVPGSQNAPAATLQTNIIGELNILEAVRQSGLDMRVHIAGSSEEYGRVLPSEVPIKETNPLRPLSPYGVSKVAQEMLALQYHYSHGLHAVVTRGFNHTGPRRGHVFVTSSLSRQVAQIEKGLRPPVILVGDVSSKRDWTDVRDFVRAYWLALDKGQAGQAYNIGSGVLREVGELVGLLLRMSTATIEVRQDESRLRPSDVNLLLSDSSKFRTLTGWEPVIPFEKTIGDLLAYWRARV